MGCNHMLRDAVLDKVAKGAYLTTLSEELGISEHVMRHWCKDAGVVPAGRRVMSPDVVRQAVEMREGCGATYKWISDTLGIRCHTLETYMRTHGDELPELVGGCV